MSASTIPPNSLPERYSLVIRNNSEVKPKSEPAPATKTDPEPAPITERPITSYTPHTGRLVISYAPQKGKNISINA